MSQAKPIKVRSSSTGIYAQIKNGNVYRLLTPITEERKEGACREIQEAGVMRLKHWVLVRTKSEQRSIDEQAGALYSFDEWIGWNEAWLIDSGLTDADIEKIYIKDLARDEASPQPAPRVAS